MGKHLNLKLYVLKQFKLYVLTSTKMHVQDISTDIEGQQPERLKNQL